MYKRILLKLSGEQLQGDQNHGFSVERAHWIANQLHPLVASGVQIMIMVGGGNYVRGAQIEDPAIPRVTADSAGMLATMINALTLHSVLEATDLPTKVLSSIKADQIIDQFTHRRALSHLSKGRVVIVAGGIGRPYITTDTAAVSLALELNCEAVLKATKVDGVFTDDPERNPDAKKLERVGYNDALTNDKIKVMDKAALGLAMEHKLPIVIFKLLKDGNIARVIHGENVGTTISD